jgi:ABC-2 type transport system ATP-binding protein
VIYMKVKFENVYKSYGKKIVLNGINIVINEGITAVTGLNGSGKSTFLKVASGILKADSGKVCTYDGEDYRDYRTNIKRYLGYLPQNFSISGDFTLYKYLEYFCVLKCIPPDAITKAVENAVRSVNMAALVHKKISTFSSGQRQRAGIAVSLLNNPGILILDEPMKGMDIEERIYFKNSLLSMERDRLIIMSSSILTDISGICDAVVVLNKGKIGYYGSPDGIRHKSDLFKDRTL